MGAVTVCISVYNGAETLERALRSAMAQTLGEVEILVLDDGSTDDSLGIASRLGVHAVRQANAGRGASLARMVELAQTEWCALLDADDWWEPNHLELLFDAASEGVDLVHADAWFHYPDGRTEDRRYRSRGPQPLDHLLPDNRIVASAAMFRRSAMLSAGNFHPGTWAACDWYGWFLIAARGGVAHVPVQTTHYTINPGSIANRGYRFQAGKRHVLKDLILPQFDYLYGDVPGRARYRRMAERAVGVAASTMAKALEGDGKRAEARSLHREAIRLAPSVPRVWSRALRNLF